MPSEKLRFTFISADYNVDGVQKFDDRRTARDNPCMWMEVTKPDMGEPLRHCLRYDDWQDEIKKDESSFPPNALKTLHDARDAFREREIEKEAQKGSALSNRAPSAGGLDDGVPKESIDEQLKKEASMERLKNQAELFLYQDGTTGFYILEFGPDCIRRLDDWAKVLDKATMKHLLAAARKRDKMHWRPPSEPDPSVDDPKLMDDMVAFIKGFVEFPQERLYYCFAAWIICTYIAEKLAHAPRWIVTAPTEHGKGRALKMAGLLAYRGVLLGDPTVAVIFRLSGLYGATVMIDEVQDLQANQKDVYGRIMSLFKIGFDVGTLISRMNNDNSAIEGYKAYSFVMLAAKNFNFKEDEQNRAIMVTMRKLTRELRADPMGDPNALEEATALRTRLHALRIRVLQGQEDIDAWKKHALDLTTKDVLLNDATSRIDEGDHGERIALGDRSKEKALSLLLPCAKFGHEDEILQVVAEAQVKAMAEQGSALSAQVFRALQCQIYGVVKGKQSDLDAAVLEMTPQELRGLLEKDKITIASVRDQLLRDLANEDASEDAPPIPDTSEGFGKGDGWKTDEDKKGSLRKYEALGARYSTKKIGNVLRGVLGFETQAGAQNKHHIVARKFQAAYRSALDSSGSRYDAGKSEP